METTPPQLNWKKSVIRGFTRRCPLCGRRGIFSSWFVQEERCPTCNYLTTRVHDQWIGSLGINIIVTFVLLVGYIIIGFAVTYPRRPILQLTAIGLVIAGVFPIVFYPISKSLWSGIDLAMQPPIPDDEIEPEYLPSSGLEE